jgi:hypothetical protein
VVIAAGLTIANLDPFHGLNAGFIALCFNFAVAGIVSALTRVRVTSFEEISPEIAPAQPNSVASFN